MPVVAFIAASPRGFYQSLIVAQIGPPRGAIRVGLLQRLYELTGLSDFRVDPASPRVPVNLLFVHGSLPLIGLIWGATAFLALATVGTTAFLILARGQTPTQLHWFALASARLVVSMFLWPSQFHYHFGAFLTPSWRWHSPCPWWQFFHQQFRVIYTDSYGDVLYKRDQQHGTRLTPRGARS